MAKLKVKGWFKEIGTPYEVGTKGFTVQDVMMVIPGYKDDFNGIDRPDEPWLMQVKGENIKKLNLAGLEGTKVEATVFVEGFAVEPTATQKGFSGYRVTLHEYTIFNPRA